MAREDPPFRVRLPEGLKEQIRISAEASGRSMTAEIVHRLEQSFAASDYDADECFADLFKKVEDLQRQIWDLQAKTGVGDPYNGDD